MKNARNATARISNGYAAIIAKEQAKSIVPDVRAKVNSMKNV